MPQPYPHGELVIVTEDGWSWHILADPDGNELCVPQPPGIPSA